jgi:hypothetical protein
MSISSLSSDWTVKFDQDYSTCNTGELKTERQSKLRFNVEDVLGMLRAFKKQGPSEDEIKQVVTEV